MKCYQCKPSFRLQMLIVVAMCTLFVEQLCLACSPSLPLPTLEQEYASTAKVYMARLKSLKRSPLSGQRNLKLGAVENATFEILLALKGEMPTSGTIKSHTEYNGAMCTLSILQPVLVIDMNGKPMANPYSDIWILFLDGMEPYKLSNLGHTRPINLFSDSDLHFLLKQGLQ